MTILPQPRFTGWGSIVTPSLKHPRSQKGEANKIKTTLL